ncbi:MAG: hypothetical protein UU65_C0002G0239 [candidate division CPR2 bacterium GW2011_GWC1_41_48]|uniref:Uncharacterized protein n=1 Tax=candidate division CPR2 bacterium GW2011_GWC1_41_48 TaxID=1618344 RepID=A0A0G0YIS8_UNCC2|nr:MAG: hypothetical protein UT47_C0002G0065 [candidate division CPR2 bacterium GW2011_GWC2_39_35]KKR28928.1 MAG: hypothetical protein UT59_C0015G0007 [candidate division CPR2 bacterium GW2011_GWD1_39_7]KKR28964.1 MAG: hypothetical protein UT60_C0008G0007 [candidate division CPR2 bacterium GW2011_GWD2_39_7]KKS09461.1 MAG: hypothetical protein UU65_C0002G0239 [candidate division CPR2 bacterium GW2011_GWC1_41_48]OGB61755.1 MAG: hypothetical protein A2Y27_02240 [candidate division CPR2 bacterium G
MIKSALLICIEEGRHLGQHLVVPQSEVDAPKHRDQSYWGQVFVKTIHFEDIESQMVGVKETPLSGHKLKEGCAIREVQLLTEQEFEQAMVDWGWL